MHMIGHSKFDVPFWPSADGRFRASGTTPVFHYCNIHFNRTIFLAFQLSPVQSDLFGLMMILTNVFGRLQVILLMIISNEFETCG